MTADLHLHSIYSDGSYTPEQLVKRAKAKAITTIAIADHDTIDATEKALTAGEKYGIEVIPAVEFSTFRGKAEIHILGYYIDYRNEHLLSWINKIFAARKERAREMISLLNKRGVSITWPQVREIAGDDYIGRPHIARAMVASGYIEEMGEAFSEDYIGNEGQAYVSKYKISPEQAIDIIKEAGGIPVLAHPVFINHGQPLERDDISRLVTSGLQGIEVFHSRQDREDSQYYLKIAHDLDLLITGGSDFHGENSPGVELGDVKLEEEYLKRLRN